MLLVKLLVYLSGVWASSGQVVVNRRARQRIPRTTAPPPPASVQTVEEDASDIGVSQRRLRVQNAFSLAFSNGDFDFGENVTVTRRPEPQARTVERVPRRRTQLSRGRNIDFDEGRTDLSARASSSTSSRVRSRSRTTPRRLNVNRDLERNERNTDASLSINTIVREPEVKTRSRSRSRFRSRTSSPQSSSSSSSSSSVPSTSPPVRLRDKVRGRGRTVSRGNYRPKSTSEGNSDTSSGSRFNNAKVTHDRSKTKSDQSDRNSGPKVIFPRKDLFPKLNKLSLVDNEVNTEYSSANNYNYKKNKERYKASLYNEADDYSRSKLDDDFEKNSFTNDYSYTDIQSGLYDTSASSGSGRDYITVIHQVPTRTVFTVIERGETKSLFAEVLETSLEVVNVDKLQSTEISNKQVYYSDVDTKYPRSGVTEYEYAAIVPTPSLTTTEHTVSIGGRLTTVVETLETTAYKADFVTHTQTETVQQDLEQISPDGVSGPGVGQISKIIQNVLLNILGGGGLLGNPAGGGGVQVTQTELITHTRTLLTTSTQTDTVLIPVNYRGTEIYQTVTEHNVVTDTTVDYSIQTLLNFVSSTKPFYPLAPTLNRAVRIVQTENPVANLYQQQPQPYLSTSVVTDTITTVTTITTNVTTPLTVTMAAQKILTEIIEPTTMVLTTTKLTTQTVTDYKPALPNQNSQLTSYLNRIKLLKTILNLRQ